MDMETNQPRTRRGLGYAGPGRATGHDLPIYICNTCHADVVWCESKRTGRKYLVTVSRKRSGNLYYMANNLHTNEYCAGVVAKIKELAEHDAQLKNTSTGYVA